MPYVVSVAPIQSISSAAPLELFGLDFLYPKTCSCGYRYSLMLSANKTAKTAADRLYNELMLRYDLLGNILTTRGENLRMTCFPSFQSIAVPIDSEITLNNQRP